MRRERAGGGFPRPPLSLPARGSVSGRGCRPRPAVCACRPHPAVWGEAGAAAGGARSLPRGPAGRPLPEGYGRRPWGGGGEPPASGLPLPARAPRAAGRGPAEPPGSGRLLLLPRGEAGAASPSPGRGVTAANTRTCGGRSAAPLLRPNKGPAPRGRRGREGGREGAGALVPRPSLPAPGWTGRPRRRLLPWQRVSQRPGAGAAVRACLCVCVRASQSEDE